MPTCGAWRRRWPAAEPSGRRAGGVVAPAAGIHQHAQHPGAAGRHAIAAVAVLSVVIFREPVYWTTLLGLALVVAGVGLLTARAG